MIGPFMFYGVPGKMTRRFAAVVIASQAIVVFLAALVAHGLAAAQDEPDSRTWLVVGIGIAVLCILDAGLLRRPFGVTLGWLLQVVTLLAAFVVPVMAFVGLVFLVLWATALVQGRKMEALTRAHLAAAEPAPDDEEAGDPPA